MSPAPSKPIALVTGASSGFGLEISRLLAQEGWRVYATYRHPRKLQALRDLSRSLDIHPIVMEVTRTPSVNQAVARIAKLEGRIDLLVNNAGFVMAGFLEDLSDEDLKAQFDTNVFGLLRVTRAVTPLMRSQKSGKIINMGSISGRVAFPGIVAYAASKFAVRALTQEMRQQLRPFGIQVCEIAPGTYSTQVVTSARYGQNVQSSRSVYRKFREQMEGIIQKEFARGKPASDIAKLVLDILESDSMKPVYMAGADAKFNAFLKWLLPDAYYEWFFTRFFPWCRWSKS